MRFEVPFKKKSLVVRVLMGVSPRIAPYAIEAARVQYDTTTYVKVIFPVMPQWRGQKEYAA